LLFTAIHRVEELSVSKLTTKMKLKRCHTFFKFLIVLACFFSEKSNAQQKENISSHLIYFRGQNGTLWN